jgi:hypothetical protein
MDDEIPDDENPALGWPKNDRPAAPKACSSLTSNYTAAWVWGRGQDSVGSSERETVTPATFETAYVGVRNSPWNQPSISRDFIGSIRSTTS